MSQPPATNTGSPAALPPPYPARPPCGPLLLKRRSALRAARLRVRAARCAALARPAPPPLARVCTSTSQQPPHRPGSRIPRAIPTTLPDSTASAAGPNTNLAEIRSEPSFPSPHFYHDIPRVKAPVATGTVPTHPNLLSWGPATHTNALLPAGCARHDTTPVCLKEQSRLATGTLSWYWRDDLSGKTNPQRLYAIQVPLNPEKYHHSAPPAGLIPWQKEKNNHESHAH